MFVRTGELTLSPDALYKASLDPAPIAYLNHITQRGRLPIEGDKLFSKQRGQPQKVLNNKMPIHLLKYSKLASLTHSNYYVLFIRDKLKTIQNYIIRPLKLHQGIKKT